MNESRKLKKNKNARRLCQGGCPRYARHAAAILLAAAMAAGMLAGCGKNGEENDKSVPAKGRYVEETVELPVQEGEEILNLERSEEGNPVLYSQTIDEQVSRQVFRYEYKDGQWAQETLGWVSQAYGGQDIYLQEVQETVDGVQVVRGVDDKMLTHIIRSADGQSGEVLDIPYLKQEGEYGYPAVTNLQIDGNGNYWLNDLYQSKMVVIDKDSLEVVREINGAQSLSSEQRMIFGAANRDVAVKTDDDVFTVFDPEFNEKEVIETGQEELIRLCNDEENWYLVSESGIIRITPGNETSEVIMDGSMGEMGSSLNYTAGFITGRENDFYVLYRQEKASAYNLVHYRYDAEAVAVPEHTLRVFGLSENLTIQDAILGFQKAHPDVKVEFTSSGKEEGITMDDIRTLNTELLGGNGADILLLDGLSAKTYIEKGVLADLSGLADELLSQDSYLEAILKNTAQKDGKVYGMPVKFSVPVIYGNEQAKAALASLGELKAYVEEHPGESIVGAAERGYIRDFLFQMYQDEVIGPDGKVDQEKMADLLDTEQKIASNAKTEAFDEFTANEMGMGVVSRIFQQGMFVNLGNASIMNHPESIATDRISCVQDMMVPYTIMRQMGYTADTLNDFYIPMGIVGINKSSGQQEMAEEFVKYLFSQEIQEKPVDDGFPVLESALDKMGEEINSEYGQNFGVYSSWSIEGEEEVEIDAGYPTAEEVADLVGRCRSLKKAATQDYVVWSIYQTEADACLGGSIDAKTAAKNIAQKVDTYLAE